MELMKRLRKLEGIVEDLSGQIEFETYKHGANSESPEATSDTMHENDRRKMTASPSMENPSLASNAPPGYSALRRTGTGGSATSTSLANAKSHHGGDVNKDFGKLVLSEKGKVRYVNNAFWGKITEEVCMSVANVLLAARVRLIRSVDRGSPVGKPASQGRFFRLVGG